MSAGDAAGPVRAISAASAARLTAMMQSVIDAGTGKRARLDRPTAGKTGTTQAARDAWFIGFTADYVIGVTGGGLPAAIWRETAVRVHEGLPPRPLKTRRDGGLQVAATGRDEKPSGGGDDSFVKSILKEVSNLLASDGSAPRRTEEKPERIDR